MYIPDDFDEETSFLNMSYMYSAEFSINEEDLAVTVDLNFVRYKIDQDINGLKVKIYFDTDSYRFKVGTTSRVNIEGGLAKGVPTTIKKLYLEDPYTIVAYYILTHYFGIKDVGLIREVIFQIAEELKERLLQRSIIVMIMVCVKLLSYLKQVF